MILRPPRSTRTDTLFPTRRSSDLLGELGRGRPRGGIALDALAMHVDLVEGRGLRFGARAGSHVRRERAGRHAQREAGQQGGGGEGLRRLRVRNGVLATLDVGHGCLRSEEHTSELQSLMRISYAVFCLKKKKKTPHMT